MGFAGTHIRDRLSSRLLSLHSRVAHSLDIALCDELEDAGALTFEALREQVTSRKLLGPSASDESLWEWWHYAQRRRIIEQGPNAGEMTLSDRGRARLRDVQRAAASPSAPKARALMRYLVPPGLTGLLTAGAISVISKNSAVAIGAGLLLVFAVLYWLASECIDYFFAKQIDPRFVRACLKRAVAWLDGHEVRWMWRTAHDAADQTAIKRLYMPPLPPLPPSP